MRAAIALLSDVGQKRQRVAILGSMRELGAHADQQHREVAQAALDSPADLVVGVGDFAVALTALAPHDARVVVSEELDALWPLLEARLDKRAVILLKASRGMRLERLVPSITDWATA